MKQNNAQFWNLDVVISFFQSTQCLFLVNTLLAVADRPPEVDLVHKVSLAHNVSFWAQKLTHFVSFWAQKLC